MNIIKFYRLRMNGSVEEVRPDGRRRVPGRMILDENYVEGPCWQIRCSLDRRFWFTSGGWPAAIGYGVTDNYGVITRTHARPFDG